MLPRVPQSRFKSERGVSDACVPLKKLPVSVNPYPWEGIESYLFRTAEHNALSVELVLRAVGLPRRKLLLSAEEHRTLCLGLNSELRELVPMNAPHPYSRYVVIAGNWIRGSHMTIRTRLCPLCVAEEGYGRLEWSFAPLAVCEKHGTYLVDSCSCNPGNRIRVQRPRYERCLCGADLRTIRARQASLPAKALAQAVVRALRNEVLGSISELLPALASAPQDVYLGDLLDLIVVLGGLDDRSGTLGPKPGRPPTAMKSSIEQFEKAANILAHWPESIHSTVQVSIGPRQRVPMQEGNPCDLHERTKQYLATSLYEWIADAQATLFYRNAQAYLTRRVQSDPIEQA